MSDVFTTRAALHAVPSPCVAVCTLNPANDFCDGCQRTIAEIAGWSAFSNDEKRQVWERIGQRRARAALDVRAKAVANPRIPAPPDA